MAVPALQKDEAARLERVQTLLSQCPKMGARPYAADLPTAVRQLVVAEIVDAYRVHCGQAAPKVGSPALHAFKNFYEGPRKVAGANRFYERYTQEWAHLYKLGIEAYLAVPERLADLEATLQNATAPASEAVLSGMMKRVVKLSTSEPVILSQEQRSRLYACGVVPTESTKQQIILGMKWLVEQGYSPVPVALRETPGGAHRYAQKQPPCDDRNNRFRGAYILTGIYPGRTDCTTRHEASHSIYHQIENTSPATMKEIKNLYARAMLADAGLIFNDEYYMGHFIHAGHPMHNDNEFFAGAAHAYSHHADRLVSYIRDPRTSGATKSYAISTWQLLRDQVFNGRVFTANQIDPFPK